MLRLRPLAPLRLQTPVDSSASSSLSWRVALAAIAVLLNSACSFIYNLDADQCKVDSDCKALGGKFAKMTCEQGVCVQPEPSDPGSTDEVDGGVDAGPTGCTSNAQCIEESLDRPAICRDGECIDLTSDACPVVLHQENLLVPEPIIIGAYSDINENNRLGSPITLTYDLVLKEFTDTVGGLPGGPNNTRRKFVAVVCDTIGPPLEDTLTHLVDTVKVRGIVSALFTDSLREAFDARGKPDNIFFMSPLNSDSSLTSEDNAGLLWFMLGGYSDMAPGYVALTKRAEAFQREAASLSEPIRVALVQGSLAPARDIGQALLSDPDNSLTFNGKAALENDEENFLFVELTSAFEDDQAEATAVIEKLSTFKPHVVVVTAGTEFTTKVLPVVEANWNVNEQVRPFYVMGPLLAFDSNLKTNVSVRRRTAGVNFAAAENRTLFNMYKQNYQAAFPNNDFAEAENFYDAVYYLLYSIAASGNPAKLTGDSIAEGMLRIVSKSGTPKKVGPSSISDVLATLAVPGSRINLEGAMGPADFNIGTGSRIAESSVWCIDADGYHYDELRLNEETQELEGTFRCITGF